MNLTKVSSNINIKIFGKADKIQFRLFTTNEWQTLLETNKISEPKFLSDLYDPDFFLHKKLPHYNNLNIATSLKDFFNKNVIYGPLNEQMAFVDMKYGRKRLFRGTLNAFLGKETFFPLVNSQIKEIVIEPKPDYVILFYIEETTGLVINDSLNLNNFSADHFNILLKNLKIGNYNKTLITGFEIEGNSLKPSKRDAVVLRRSAYVLKY